MKPWNASDPPVAPEVAGTDAEVFAARAKRLGILEGRRGTTGFGMTMAILATLIVTCILYRPGIGWAWMLVPAAVVLPAVIAGAFLRRTWLNEINTIRTDLSDEERRWLDWTPPAVPMLGETASLTDDLNWRIAMEAYRGRPKHPYDDS